jgi:hypothetical protein
VEKPTGQAAPVELTDEQIHKVALKHAFLAYERIERRQAQDMLIGFARAILAAQRAQEGTE